jgi:FlaA1/EpsC-like NDP-sugar epimerase
MTRFFLTPNNLTSLVEKAAVKTQGGEVFLHKMPAINIGDLARAMIETVAPRYGYEPADIDIEITGSRVGETYHEEIMTEREANRALESETLYAIPPETNSYLSHDGINGLQAVDDIVRSSETATKLSQDEIISLLRSTDVLEADR